MTQTLKAEEKIRECDFSRFNFPEMLNQMGLKGRAAEIGVCEGHFSRCLLERWGGQKLYMVDCWAHLQFWNDPMNKNRIVQAERFNETFHNVYDFGERACIIRDRSVEAAKLFQNESLDFVYIDASHFREDVEKDFFAWELKVKPGGVVAGDDYFEPEDKECPAHWAGVGEFLHEEIIKIATGPIFITVEEKADVNPSWFYVKGGA